MLFQLIIIQVVTFLAIVFVLRRLLYAETAKEARRLKMLKEENTQKQRELQEKIDAAEKVYSERIREAEEEIHRLKRKAEEEAEEERARIIEKAKKESERALRASLNAKEEIREEAFKDVEKKIPILAAQIFKEVLSPETREMVHEELVKKTIEEIQKIDKAKFRLKIKRGELLFAYPLGKNNKTKLVDIICDKLGYRIDFSEKEDKKLVAGLVINLGTLVIDGSLEDRLRQVREGM